MPIDDRTTNRNYQLPNAGNLLSEDVQRLRDALTAIDADVFARYTKTETDQKLADLINGAPGALNTLNELAAAMGNDPNFATTITNALAGKPGFADVWTRTQADARYVQGVTQTENVFTGTGSQTTFTLTQAPPSRESILVTVDGVVQPTTAYNLSGSALILSEAPLAGASIRVLMLGVAGPVQSASTLSFTQAGAGAVTRTVDSKLKDVLSVKDFGAVGDGIADDTAAIQAAIDAAKGDRQVFIPAGTYLVTDTLNLYKGSSLHGINRTQGHASYAAGSVGSRLQFSPSSQKDLFTVQDLPSPAQSFKGKVSVGGLWIDGNTTGGGTNSRHCLVLPTVIYGNFYDLEVRYFQSGFNCTDTINNRFSNIRVANCSVSCVEYSGSAPPTTDVWSQCTFTDAPIGVRLASGIAIRFDACLLENIANFGVDVAKECANIEWIGTYAENLPSTSSGAVFNVGFTGSTSSLNNSLKVIGGKFAGNNTSVEGSFISADDTKGILLTAVAVSRFTNVIKTTAATADYAVCCAGLQFIACPVFATNTAKLSGFLDYNAVNAAAGPSAYLPVITTGRCSFTGGPTPVGVKTKSAIDDYQEGTWVASLIGSTGGPTVPVTATAKYTKVGRLVTVQAYFANVNTTGASGTIRVNGLPFAAGSDHCYGTAGQNGLGGAVPIANVPPGAGYIDILDAATTVPMNMLAGGGKYLFITATYST